MNKFTKSRVTKGSANINAKVLSCLQDKRTRLQNVRLRSRPTITAMMMLIMMTTMMMRMV
jgi:hypothetical protein